MMYAKNSRPKKEFTPRKWKKDPPFKKSVVVPLPEYSVEELQLLKRYFEDYTNRLLTQEIAKALGSNRVITVSGSTGFLMSSPTSTPQREAINYEDLDSLASFHKLLKGNPNRLPPFKIPFNELPLFIGKPHPGTRAYWHESVIAWRLQIGR